MGTKERRDRERQELRQAILMASRDIAAREGWQSVSIRKVAERIEYSPPTIYEHFASKEAMLLELMREGFRLLMERRAGRRAAPPRPEARMMAVARAYWEFAWDYPELYQVMHGLGGVPSVSCGDRGARKRADLLAQSSFRPRLKQCSSSPWMRSKSWPVAANRIAIGTKGR